MPSEQISRRQSQVDRLYVSLKDLAEERKARLEQQYWLYQLSREVDELEHWIAEKEVVAGSPELGQDYEHVTVSGRSLRPGRLWPLATRFFLPRATCWPGCTQDCGLCLPRPVDLATRLALCRVPSASLTVPGTADSMLSAVPHVSGHVPHLALCLVMPRTGAPCWLPCPVALCHGCRATCRPGR